MFTPCRDEKTRRTPVENAEELVTGGLLYLDHAFLGKTAIKLASWLMNAFVLRMLSGL